ncbi:MAG: hypothetical protein AAF724_22395 [Pseudomonadota bacterium]
MRTVRYGSVSFKATGAAGQQGARSAEAEHAHMAMRSNAQDLRRI